MTASQEFHLLYKKIGETPLEAIYRYKNDHPNLGSEKFTYAGRLDPMAEGLLLILSGNEVLDKEKYIDLDKSYEFEILWGVSTDTSDVLGKVLDCKNIVPSKEELANYFNNIKGRFEQSYPAFSSKTVNGKPLFEWSRKGKISEIDIPKHFVEIKDILFLNRKIQDGESIYNEIVGKIDLVKGDFRQEEVLEVWKNFFKNNNGPFYIDKISVNVSSGFYVRQFVKDLGDFFDTDSVTFSIKRTQVGKFSLADIK